MLNNKGFSIYNWSRVPRLLLRCDVFPWEQRKLSELSVEVQRKAPVDSKAPIMMIATTSGFVEQSTHYARDNTGQSLKNYTLLKEGELSYNHGYSKIRNYGSVFALSVKEARIPFVYHSFSMPNENPYFFGHYLNSGRFDRDLKKLISSTARMDGLMNISYDEFMSLRVRHPVIEEQDRITFLLNSLDSLITLHQRE